MSGQRPGFVEFIVSTFHSQDTPKTLPRLTMCSKLFKHVETLFGRLESRDIRNETWGPFQAKTSNYQTFVPAFLMFQKMTPINAMPKTPTFGNLSGEKMSQCRWRSVWLVFQRRSLVEFANCLVVDICASKNMGSMGRQELIDLLEVPLITLSPSTLPSTSTLTVRSTTTTTRTRTMLWWKQQLQYVPGRAACHHLQHMPV